MYPAYLIRASIDWVRHSREFEDSNPYSRCEESIKLCRQLWEEQVGQTDLSLVEPATVTAYWSEFFHTNDPLPDEHEWQDGLTKGSAQYDSFDEWQEFFKQSYARFYKNDIIWMGVLTTAWAHTHQYDVLCSDDAWEFQPARSYLHTADMWRLEPYIDMVSEVIEEIWSEEAAAYREAGFALEQERARSLGKPECLGFDLNQPTLIWPPRSRRDRQVIGLGEIVADLILPPGDNWYRQMDNVIFAHDCVDLSALFSRARYVFGSHRRFLELVVDNPPEQARLQSRAEGWLDADVELAAV